MNSGGALVPPYDLVLRSRYGQEPSRREALLRFLRDLHGLDLRPWIEAGWWDGEDYAHYSLFDGGEIVSSVGLYSLDMVVGGRPVRVGQISGVGTRPAWRRRGLARWLLQRVLAQEEGRHAGFFLFADDQALSLYRGCGFAPLDQRAPLLRVDPLPEGPPPRRLDLDRTEDRDLLARLAHGRLPVSERLGVHGARLLLFHAAGPLSSAVWHLPALDLAVLARRDGDGLTLYDLVGPRIPAFAELREHLRWGPCREICFRFPVDRLGIEPTGHRELPGENAHVRGPLDWPAEIFPHTAHA